MLRNQALAVLSQLPLLHMPMLAVLPHVQLWYYQSEPWVHLPAMAHLAPVLTSLQLVGAVSLPPDWRQLSRLQRLQVHNQAEWAALGNLWSQQGDAWGWFDWGSIEDSLAPLAALEHLEFSERAVLPGEFAAGLCSCHKCRLCFVKQRGCWLP